MSESENTEVTDSEIKPEISPRKRVRHRKKKLYEDILKQMEFYFSDANLTKDRYLGDLVKNDPFVPLNVFLRFNKVRSLTQDVNDIAKAVKHSSMLELSEDRTKVQRKTPIAQYDADARTVYVESIPVTASRDWLERVFTDYGKVAYISLPKFKNSQKIKGYGFIEFYKPEDAQKCIAAFTKMGCKLPTCMPPEDLSSIKMFSIEEQPNEAEKKHEVDEPPKKKKKGKDKKLKLEIKENVESDTEKKVETPSEEKCISFSTPAEENKTDIKIKDELTSQDEGDTKEGIRKKKIRKRTARERSKAKNRLGPNEAPKGALWGLQVLSKSEWKSLRNKYLNLQRKYMKELKASLYKNRHEYRGMSTPAALSADAEPVINASKESGSRAPLDRIPGVFVRQTLPEPCLDVRTTKRTVKSNIHALHVEVLEGQSELIIRFDSAKAAEEYCASSLSPAAVLPPAEEAAQWALAERARAAGGRRARRAGGGAGGGSGGGGGSGAAPPLAPDHPQASTTHIRFDD